MSKQPRQTDSNPPAFDKTRLIVWAEWRDEPDWDSYLAALLSHSLHQVEKEAKEAKGESGG